MFRARAEERAMHLVLIWCDLSSHVFGLPSSSGGSWGNA